MRMNWHDLLFMHWKIDVECLRKLIPSRLTIDTYGGTAWLGIVPFRMTGVAPRFSPNLPFISSFPELNVRTYVSADGKPGVWFFSLEATNWLVNGLARRLFHLNYMNAKIQFKTSPDPTGKWIGFRSNRVQKHENQAGIDIEYRPIGPTFHPESGSIEEYLTSRYCLYTANQEKDVFRGEIDHAPWQIRVAQAIVRKNTMTQGLGLALSNTPPLLHYANLTKAVAWSLERI